ncbi:MAG: FAD-binding protein [Actinomycetota bacterium]
MAPATLTSTDPVLAEFAADIGADGPIAVAGGRTRWELGGALADGTRVVAAPTGIVEYIPDEMTVTVRAGTTVAELHRTLAERGQRTGLPDRGGTVGGALAVGENDLRALGRGPVRNALLQIRYVSADGRIVSSGGPTVKNVSGFDLPRLMVGSLGTLGMLGEAILRTNPIPPHARWLAAEGVDPGEVHEVLLAPSAILWDGETTWVQLEGHAADVDAQRLVLDGLGSFRTVDLDDSDALPVELPANRWSCTPAEAAGFGTGVGADAGRFVAAVGLGLVFAERPQPPRVLAPAAAVVSERLKQNFDPTGRCNPGRVVGGR